jgi:hypothetical protein
MIPIELVAHRVCWSDGDSQLSHIPEPWLDLIGFLSARRLLEQGYDVNRLLIVRLQNADFELMRAPLGAAAATPIVNIAAPVKHPTKSVFRRETAA